jgi:hypothetical protein
MDKTIPKGKQMKIFGVEDVERIREGFEIVTKAALQRSACSKAILVF